MNVLGIDFTSRPTRRKPISCLHCTLERDVLCAGDLEEWTDFDTFELALQRPGPWIVGIDFPFGQARRFIETIGWPRGWPDYVRRVQSLSGANSAKSSTHIGGRGGLVTRNTAGKRTLRLDQSVRRSFMVCRSA
jgi:hypothetical protein